MIRKKKSLGQHFLRAKNYLAAVADAVEIVLGETVLEVGPGDGALTKELLARGARVVAVEKDRRLIPILKEKFKDYDISKFQVIEGDALEFDISNHITMPHKTEGYDVYKVVGNIPYYITGALIKKFLSAEHQPTALVFLVQKEVAQRITGHPSTKLGVTKESILSLSVKAYGTPCYIKTVPAGAFVPPPKVESAILAVTNVSRGRFTSIAHEERFFDLLHKGFGSKRKLLASNLKPLLGERTVELLEKAGVPKNARAEDVPLEAWLALSNVDGLILAHP